METPNLTTNATNNTTASGKSMISNERLKELEQAMKVLEKQRKRSRERQNKLRKAKRDRGLKQVSMWVKSPANQELQPLLVWTTAEIAKKCKAAVENGQNLEIKYLKYTTTSQGKIEDKQVLALGVV